jgi:hypothetical protein
MTSPTLRLLDWARTHGPDVLDAIGRALVIAQQAHRDEQRRSGDPYITHPVEVALILADQDAAPETVVTAVLHDVLDARSPRPLAELRTQFGEGSPTSSSTKPDSTDTRTTPACGKPTGAHCRSRSPTACTTCAPSGT